jgi:hypothetical protein
MIDAEQAKAKSRGVSGDMSSNAISRRFDILVELDRAARELRSATRVPHQRGDGEKRQ